MNMKQSGRLFFWGLAAAMTLAACGTKDRMPEAPEAKLDMDTATAASAPVAEQPDTTKQVVETLRLRAIGNTPEEMHYDQDTLTARAGALVKLQLVNEAQDMPMVHNVVFTTPGKYKLVALEGERVGASGNYVPKIPAVIAASPMVLPGQTVEMEFTAPAKAGDYDFVCTYPDHWRRMNGTLVVKK